MPQSSGGDEAQNIANWDSMRGVPKVGQHPAAEGRFFYNSTFFSTMALDMVLLGELTGELRLATLAAGHLNWVLGLNPGIPATKVVSPAPGGTAWKAAAFVQNVGAAQARGFENFRKPVTEPLTNQKSSIWGGEDWDVHREVWWCDPLENGFMSIVNGHVLWEGEWDYFNTGEFGSISGETFLLNDGLYARALVAYEDWLVGRQSAWVSMGGGFISAGAARNQDGRLEIVAAHANGTCSTLGRPPRERRLPTGIRWTGSSIRHSAS